MNELWWWKWYYDDDEDDIEDDDDDDNGNDKNVDVTPRRCTHPWRRIKHHNIWLLGNWHTYLPWDRWWRWWWILFCFTANENSIGYFFWDTLYLPDEGFQCSVSGFVWLKRRSLGGNGIPPPIQTKSAKYYLPGNPSYQQKNDDVGDAFTIGKWLLWGYMRFYFD